MKKVITHSGIFHADEITAIALIRIGYPKIEIGRTFKPNEDDLNDPEVFVVDVGGRYQPELGNFDHHQDASLEASNILVLESMCERDQDWILHLKKNLFQRISDIDTGKLKEEKGQSETFTGLIRSLNSLPDGFESGVEIATTAIRSQFEVWRLSEKSKSAWALLEKKGKVAITESADIIVGWQDLAATEGVMMLVSPNARGGYQILSVDSDILEIPPSPKQTFRHNSGFLAVYASKEDAIEHAMSL